MELFNARQVVELMKVFKSEADTLVAEARSSAEQNYSTIKNRERDIEYLEKLLKLKAPTTYKKWKALSEYSVTYQDDLEKLMRSKK